LAAALLAVASLAPCCTPAHCDPSAGIVPPSQLYSRLSADWWQWALSMPVRNPPYTGAIYHPLWDLTGAAADNGQDPSSCYYYIGGAMGYVLNDVPVWNQNWVITRDITIPSGKHLFFPILNYEADNITIPPTNYGIAVLRRHAADAVATYEGLYASIDGQAVQGLSKYRVVSIPFSYRLSDEDNIYQVWGMDVTGTCAPAVSDGYWLLLKPLSPGNHVITFGGAGWDGTFTLDITYNIAVLPAQ